MSNFSNKIRRKIGNGLLKLFGWKKVGMPPTVAKYVCIIAPHTSIADMFIGKWYNWATDMKPKIIIKKEFFFFPIGPIIRSWGAVPINRSKAQNVVNQMAEYFSNTEKIILAITPEGTRKINHNWKTGFYRIAEKANVPIYLTYIDFKTKKVGFMGEFVRTGNMQADIQAIQLKYKNVGAKHPALFSVGENIAVFDNDTL